MKYLFPTLLFILLVVSCETTKAPIYNNSTETKLSDTIRIANESIEYEIIIIEPGFHAWLVTQPPKGYYGLNYLENKNKIYVAEYNYRVYAPGFNKKLYLQEINYDPSISYGLEVNYLLYNYFKYFEKTYNQ